MCVFFHKWELSHMYYCLVFTYPYKSDIFPVDI